jgi:hypothetical protein
VDNGNLAFSVAETVGGGGGAGAGTASDGDEKRARLTGSRGTLYLHVSLADLATTSGGGRVERPGTASLTLLRDWLQRLTGVTIRPVLDPTRTDAVDTHDPPAWMREVVILRDRHCVFPGCPATPAPATSTTSSPTRHRLLMAVPSPQLEGVGTTPRR